MPCQSSGGRPAPHAAPRLAARRPTPQPDNPLSVRLAMLLPYRFRGSSDRLLSGIVSTIAQGVVFGTGSAVAHRAVESVMGPRTVHHEMVGAPAAAETVANAGSTNACSIHSKAFQDCMNNFGSDIRK